MPNVLKNYACAALAEAARKIVIEEMNEKRGKPKSYIPTADHKVDDTVTWRGIHKVQEEMNEFGVELCKLVAFPSGTYPDHGGVERNLLVDVIKEATDMKAAFDYFMETNGITINWERYREKRAKFDLWGLKGAVDDGERNA